MLAELLVVGISLGCIYALVGLGFNLVFNATNVFNFAQGDFLMVGGMVFLTSYTSRGLPLIVSIPVTILVTALITYLVQKVLIQPLRKKKSSVIMMVLATLAFSVIAENGGQAVWGISTYPVPNFLPMDIIKAGGVVVRTQDIVIIVSTGILLACLWWFFERTMTGKAFRACAISQETAQLCGVNVGGMISLAFILSGAISAVAGAVVDPIVYASATMGINLGIIGFAAAVVGGMGKPFGAVVGGVFLGIVESLWAGYVSPGYAHLLGFAAMLIVLYLRPQGILGGSIRIARRKRELSYEKA